MHNYRLVSPLRLLEDYSIEEMGPGKLGVVISRAGGGKTATLVHIAIDLMFQGNRIVHVSLEETPDKVSAHYEVRFKDIAKALQFPDDFDMDSLFSSNRMILAYMNGTFSTERLKENLDNLAENLGFRPDAVMIDGLLIDNPDRAILEDLRSMAEGMNLEIWLSALSHRHIKENNSMGVPFPISDLDDLFTAVFQLRPEGANTCIYLLKPNGDSYPERPKAVLASGTLLLL